MMQLPLYYCLMFQLFTPLNIDSANIITWTLNSALLILLLKIEHRITKVETILENHLLKGK